VLFQLLHVLGVVAPRQDAAMDNRVQGLHPPGEHFRKLRYLAHLAQWHLVLP
jgi:hypothetical protein